MNKWIKLNYSWLQRIKHCLIVLAYAVSYIVPWNVTIRYGILYNCISNTL